MHTLPVPSATFDERLIQRSGSGETDNTSSNAQSGLVTPQDEGTVPLLGQLDLKQADEIINCNLVTSDSATSGKEEQWKSGRLDSDDIGGVALAQPVVMSKMISSTSGSSVAQSPEFEDPQVTHAKTKAMYNLPNRHISIEIPKSEVNTSVASRSMSSEAGLIRCVQGSKYSDDDDFRVEDYTEPSLGLLRVLADGKWTRNMVVMNILRTVLFLPWCITVGGSIVLCPKGLDVITFHSGYLEPLSGIYRFAHWADHAFEHIMIFVCFTGCIFWLSPGVGFVVGCAMGAMVFNAWYDFRLDPSVPLGEDDRQSVYLSLTKFWMTDGFLNLRRVNGGFLLDDQMQGERRGEEPQGDGGGRG